MSTVDPPPDGERPVEWPTTWVGDPETDRPFISEGTGFHIGGDVDYEPRLRIGFQLTPKPVYRVRARGVRADD